MNYASQVKEEGDFFNYVQETPAGAGIPPGSQAYYGDQFGTVPQTYYNDPILEAFNRPSDSISDASSPSTNANSVLAPHHGAGQASPDTHVDDKPRRKGKRAAAEDKDAALLARDDAELTEHELALKRKAQNRAAQRAFRERKETKLKQLEEKLNKSEEEKQKLLEQLDSFKEKTIFMQAENDLLKRSSENTFTETASHTKFDFPSNEGEFIDSLIKGTNHVVKPEHLHKVYDAPDNGKRVLAVGAVWDYLVYKAEEEGLNIDVVEVMSRLRGNERCHGFGPAYPLDLVNQVIKGCTTT